MAAVLHGFEHRCTGSQTHNAACVGLEIACDMQIVRGMLQRFDEQLARFGLSLILLGQLQPC